jgi:hypothetical protein
MKLELFFSDQERTAPITVATNSTVAELVSRIEAEADVDGLSIIQMALESEIHLDDALPVDSLKFKHHHLRVHRVCVEVIVEGEPAKRKFPETARWARVHRWACRKFEIAPDSCANLEMHLNTPDGPVVNERKAIGHHDDCVKVWLVKPGAEPNGT